MTSDRQKKLDEFLAWFGDNSGRLREAPAADAAEEIGTRLIAVDERLGIEVGEEDDGTARELVITAFSDPSLFEGVQHLADAMSGAPGWQLVALKSARGFKFDLELGPRSLEASRLNYLPLSDDGVAIVVPAEVGRLLPPPDEAEEMAWLVVESGIGEALAARLNHLEFVVGPKPRSRPIAELADFLRSRGA